MLGRRDTLLRPLAPFWWELVLPFPHGAVAPLRKRQSTVWSAGTEQGVLRTRGGLPSLTEPSGTSYALQLNHCAVDAS